jgi:hypothetical protein
MAELRQCEFFLLRYVPDAVKDEFVNIGVVLRSADGEFADLRFTQDLSRVRCLDPAADLEVLEALENEIRAQLQAGGTEREKIMYRLEDSFSNLVQLSPVKGCLAESPQAEIELLARMYLESNRRERQARSSARARIVTRMRDAFETAGVWKLMWKKVPAARYTRSGDPLKIDCGYRPNGVIRLFHGVALEGDPEAAKVLAFSYPELREGIRRVEGASAELTAIVEDADSYDEQVRFARETLERSYIKIATLAQLGDLAQQAQRELKV